MQANWQPTYVDSIQPLRRTLCLAILSALYFGAACANPDGAHVVHGEATITSKPGLTTVTNSPNAIINWQNFSIDQNETTRFVQQNNQSAVLNRIVGQNPSAILGSLVSNGKVLLINPNGVVFGAGSVVDTQGLIASSLNLSNQDFLRGNFHFIAGPQSGAILNEGLIRAGKDGNIVLIAPSITNNGIIKSEGGQITLAAGQELQLTSLDDPTIRFQVKAPANEVLNLGKLLTEGGAVNVFASSIKHSGEINANSVSVDAQGNVTLLADSDITLSETSKIKANNSQGDAGHIQIESKTGTTLAEGVISAKGQGNGGKVLVLGEQVGLAGQARIDASGTTGGGKILVGGDVQGKNAAVHNAKATYLGQDTQLIADAKDKGKGGTVVAWANDTTRAYGQISARGGSASGDGGFVETSAHSLDTTGIRVDASAVNGKGGEWLLDPYNITIGDKKTTANVSDRPVYTTYVSGKDKTDISAADIKSVLDSGTSVKVATSGKGSQEGNIIVESPIVKESGADASLSLTAHNNITIKAPIRSTAGKLNVNLTPNIADGGGKTTINRNLLLNSGQLTASGDVEVGPKVRISGQLTSTTSFTVDGNSKLDMAPGSSFETLTINDGALPDTSVVDIGHLIYTRSTGDLTLTALTNITKLTANALDGRLILSKGLGATSPKGAALELSASKDMILPTMRVASLTATAGGNMLLRGKITADHKGGIVTLVAGKNLKLNEMDVSKLTARSKSNLILNGDITASGGKTDKGEGFGRRAIRLLAKDTFNNEGNYKLTTGYIDDGEHNNLGRWLVYAGERKGSDPGDLNDFGKHHYACVNVFCGRQGRYRLTNSELFGNNLFYKESPVLTVTPEGETVYGTPVGYQTSGFYDEDIAKVIISEDSTDTYNGVAFNIFQKSGISTVDNDVKEGLFLSDMTENLEHLKAGVYKVQYAGGLRLNNSLGYTLKADEQQEVTVKPLVLTVTASLESGTPISSIDQLYVEENGKKVLNTDLFKIENNLAAYPGLADDFDAEKSPLKSIVLDLEPDNNLPNTYNLIPKGGLSVFKAYSNNYDNNFDTTDDSTVADTATFSALPFSIQPPEPPEPPEPNVPEENILQNGVAYQQNSLLVLKKELDSDKPSSKKAMDKKSESDADKKQGIKQCK